MDAKPPIISSREQANAALWIAADDGDAEGLAAALEAGADPDAMSPQGATAAMLAAAKGRRECLELLAPISDLSLRAGPGVKALGWAGTCAGRSALEIGLAAAPVFCAALTEHASAKQAAQALEWLDQSQRWIPPYERRQLMLRLAHATAEDLSGQCLSASRPSPDFRL